MAQALGKKAAKSVFAKHIAGMEPQDPLYEQTTDARGKKKRVRRQLPPGLSKRDQRILEKIKKRAHYLDKGISLCGFRVGWTFWIGLIPGAGDVADAALNYFLVLKPAKKAEIPSWLVSQMVVNNSVSAAVGFIPLVGDIVLGIWKANSRNAHLLEEYLAIRGQEYLALQGHIIEGSTTGNATADPKLHDEYKPGAGMAPGEVILPPGAPGAQQQQNGGFFGRFRGNNQAQAPVGQANMSYGATQHGAQAPASAGTAGSNAPQLPSRSAQVQRAQR